MAFVIIVWLLLRKLNLGSAAIGLNMLWVLPRSRFLNHWAAARYWAGVSQRLSTTGLENPVIWNMPVNKHSLIPSWCPFNLQITSSFASMDTFAGTVKLGFSLKTGTCNAPADVQPPASLLVCISAKIKCIPWSKYKIKNHRESPYAVI
jgi:hypothetical protein